MALATLKVGTPEGNDMDRVTMRAECGLTLIPLVALKLVVGVGQHCCPGLRVCDLLHPKGVRYTASSAVWKCRTIPLQARLLGSTLDFCKRSLELSLIHPLELFLGHERRDRVNVVANYGGTTFRGFN